MFGLYHYLSRLTPGYLVIIFTIVNILNYLDRGIVPGAFESLGEFVGAEFHVNNTDTYTGALQSSFIGGYSVASLTFGHLVHSYPPFKLMAVGLVIWVGAVVLSGLAPNFGALVAGRVLSGVGEASFQCVVPPYIDDNAPPAKRALWLSAFYMAIPVGTAIGYAYGGAVGASSLTWRWAFIMEAFPMAPLIVLIWFLPYSKHRRQVIEEVEQELETDTSTLLNQPAGSGGGKPGVVGAATGTRGAHPHLRVHSGAGHHLPHHVPPTDEEVMREVKDELQAAGDTAALADTVTPEDHKPSFWQELKVTLTNPLYMSVVFGYAGYIAVTSGLGTFAPTFVLDLKLVNSQTIASLSAGAVVSVAGAIGTPIGGYFVDRGARKMQAWLNARRAARCAPTVEVVAADGSASAAPGGGDENATRPDVLDVKLVTAMFQAFTLCAIGAIFVVAAIYVTAGTTNLGAYLAVLAGGIILLMGTTAGINLALMAAVPPENRSFAIGISTMLTHALGDVPAPPIIGFIGDALAPKHDCVGTSCQRSGDGLRMTLGLTAAWLFWPIVCWAFAYFAAKRRMDTRLATGWYDEQEALAAAGKTAAPAGTTKPSSRRTSLDDPRVKLLDSADHGAARPGRRATAGTRLSTGGYAPPSSELSSGVEMLPSSHAAGR